MRNSSLPARLEHQANNVERDGHLNAARYMREAAYHLSNYPLEEPSEMQGSHPCGESDPVVRQEPVAFTTFNQLAELGKLPRVAHSMWGEKSGHINIPLYAAPVLPDREEIARALCEAAGGIWTSLVPGRPYIAGWKQNGLGTQWFWLNLADAIAKLWER